MNAQEGYGLVPPTVQKMFVFVFENSNSISCDSKYIQITKNKFDILEVVHTFVTVAKKKKVI